MTSMCPKKTTHVLEYTKFPLSEDLEIVCGTRTVSLPQSDPLSWFSTNSIHNWFHMWQLWIVSPKCSSMASVQMMSSDNVGFVPGLFSWLLVFQCSCFDKQYQNTFFLAPRGWWVLVFSGESGVHFLRSLHPRETTISKYFPSVQLMRHAKRLETVV